MDEKQSSGLSSKLGDSIGEEAMFLDLLLGYVTRDGSGMKWTSCSSRTGGRRAELPEGKVGLTVAVALEVGVLLCSVLVVEFVSFRLGALK